MKFPSASAGGLVPSGNSLAVTYPDVFGSRVGGVGRAGRDAAGGLGLGAWAIAGFAPIIKCNTVPSNAASEVILAIFILSVPAPEEAHSTRSKTVGGNRTDFYQSQVFASISPCPPPGLPFSCAGRVEANQAVVASVVAV